MIIYNILNTKNVAIVLTKEDADIDYWTTNVPVDAEIVEKDENKYCNVLYAVKHDTKNMSTSDLMNIMFTKLSTEDVKLICDNDDWIKELFFSYLSNGEVKEQIKRAMEEADSASCMASLSFLSNLLK